MTIKSKLSLQTGLVVVSVAVITINFVTTLWNLDRIEKERMILSRLSLSASEFIAVVNCLDSDQVAGVRERFDEAAASLEAAFDATGSITVLPRSSEELGQSMEIITNLRPLVQETTSSVAADYDVLTSDVVKYFYEAHSNRILQFYTSEYARGKYDLTEVYAHLESFFTTVAGASITMESVSGTLSEQEAVIDEEIRKRQSAGIIVNVVIAFITCIGLVIFNQVISRSIRSRVRQIGDSLRPIGEGNLTESIPVVGNDEISGIANSINALIRNLGSLIRSTKEKVAILGDKGDDLSSHMEETSASILQINGRISDNEKHLGEQTASVRMTAESADRLTSNSKLLDAQISGQTRIIEQSAASVEEMIANINELTSTTGKVDSAASELLSVAETGQGRIDSVTGSIREINQSSDNLLDAAKLINNIASQTNLLAMNAAIEAAHAGSAGMGFAVVADEIRNLANQSSNQAKRVTSDLKAVKNSLQRVSVLSDEAQSSFHDILDQVREVRDLVGGVSNALDEQSSGSAALLSEIGDLRSIAANVSEAGAAMLEANVNICGSIEQLQLMTNLVNDNNTEIFQGTGEINSSVQFILRMTEENRDLINTLDAETAKFVID